MSSLMNFTKHFMKEYHHHHHRLLQKIDMKEPITTQLWKEKTKPDKYFKEKKTTPISLMDLEAKFIQFSSVMSDSFWPHELQHARPPCPSPTPGVHPNPCPLSQWCHPTISSSVMPFSSHLQSFPAPGSFPVSWFFLSGGQSIGVSASTSVLPMNT